MPSHIDAWVGQWKEAIDCNIAAVEADDKYVELTGNESQFYKFSQECTITTSLCGVPCSTDGIVRIEVR